MILTVFKDEFLEFLNFLYKKNILASGIGFVIALQINSLFLNILEDLIKPIASKVISEDVNKHYIVFYGIKFKIGHLFVSILNFIITLILVFYLYRISMKTPTLFDRFLNTISFSYNKVKESITFHK